MEAKNPEFYAIGPGFLFAKVRLGVWTDGKTLVRAPWCTWRNAWP